MELEWVAFTEESDWLSAMTASTTGCMGRTDEILVDILLIIIIIVEMFLGPAFDIN